MENRSSRTHRELELLDVLRRLGGTARNSDLAKALDVSEETVRRTIKALSKSGAVERVHGGAYLAGTQSGPSFFRRISQHSEQKRLIAGSVGRKVRDGMSIFLDAGSTTAFVAEELRQHGNLTVVTNSIGVAQILAGVNGNRVHLLGGEMQGDERGTFGHVAHRQAQRYVFDLAILSTDAISARRGFLYLSEAEADLASVVVESADRVLVAAVHFKFGETAPYHGPDPRRVHDLVTDRKPKGALADSLKKWGIKTNLATGEER
ncbi:DeoR family transcriptional regulator [Ruegeria marisrubri]|uniref:DeoR family transcriptional regulator n=1 Tax=Ruegeria marisrubri TaxID=1685379 RepID=A0A0X3TYY2_9RHOB|nr:DeoR/GlpR family DNA-binding transcription regulator [Ruegeria marisrubri]KUJ80928.1 DeoR family transcriptional regulator [Ruegeria marisrubri]